MNYYRMLKLLVKLNIFGLLLDISGGEILRLALYTRYTIVARRASKGILHTKIGLGVKKQWNDVLWLVQSSDHAHVSCDTMWLVQSSHAHVSRCVKQKCSWGVIGEECLRKREECHYKRYRQYYCIQDTLSSRAALVQPLGRVRRASKGILHTRIHDTLVYKTWNHIFVRAWPGGRVHARAKVSCIQKILYRPVRDWPSGCIGL